ncbi:TRAP transporter substrate-binding protein [Halalkalicoccus tibetensis]|uniref:TRAP transporter substrate-binding protein n=1 Tax=Halalkalicoccus tibetensis TaxID=175632 RepID=A0ABD5V1M4_9EURY
MTGPPLTRRAALRAGAGIASAGSFALAGCLGGADEGTGELTIASSFEPDHVNVIAAERFAERIEEGTDGRLSIEIVAGGAYGSEDEISEIVNQGGVEAHAAGSVPYYLYAPEYWFFGCPLVIDDYEHLLELTEGEAFSEARELLAERGNQRPIGRQIYRGERHTTANRPIREPDDLAGLDLRLPEFDPWVAIWQAIGAQPTPIALDELYSALQVGTVDATEGDADQISSVQLNEVQTHLSMTAHQIANGNLYVNDGFFRGLDEAYRELFFEAGHEATVEATELAMEREQELLDELADSGMTIVDDVDREAFREAARPAIEELFETDWAGSWEGIRG